jgi:hypothetical protein
MSLTSELEQLARSGETHHVGMAPVERLVNAPAGWRPTDILDQAASVVIVAIGIGQGVRHVQAKTRSEVRTSAKYGVYVYQAFGYNTLNDKLDLAAYAVTKALEDAGHERSPHRRVRPTTHDYSRPSSRIGTRPWTSASEGFGWNRLLLTPYGGATFAWSP